MSETTNQRNPGIVRLTVSNLLRIKAAEVTPDGALVVVAGSNDAGKSSLLNSIAIALSGKDIPAMPVRQGATSGYVILETEELTVTKKFTLSGAPALEVRDKDGVKLTSPQSKLDTLISKTTFDPFEFTREKPEKQLETLRRVTGLDFTALDQEKAAKYEQRTGINRQAKLQEGVLSGIPRDTTAPKEQVSVAALMEALEEVQQYNQANTLRRAELSRLNDELDEREEVVKTLHVNAEHAKAVLRAAETALRDGQSMHAEVMQRRDDMKTAVAALTDKDPEPIKQQIKDADTINATIRQNQRWSDEHKKLIGLQSQSGELTQRLGEIEQEKQAAMEKAAFPVPGLSFGESGVLYNNVPFEQAGTAVKIRTSLAIARSLNPKLPVMFIRDGSLLDENSMTIVRDYAAANGIQCWLEVVGSSDEATVVIEDGESFTPAAAKAKRGAAK